MFYTEERNNFVKAINKYFGYEIRDMQQFKEEFEEEFRPEERTEELLDFILWHERKLGR